MQAKRQDLEVLHYNHGLTGFDFWPEDEVEILDYSRCGDCRDMIYWNEQVGMWQHVLPARSTCWLAHGNGSVL